MWKKLASGGAGMLRGRVITKDLMGSQKPGGTIEVVDLGLSPPVSPVDAIFYDILKRLRLMRDIAEAAATVPMTREELAKKQEEVILCRSEIDELSGMLSQALTPERKQSVDMSIKQASDMIEGLLNDAIAGTEKEPISDEKAAAWMDSVMKGWDGGGNPAR
ncbi:MAG: hypothetical protein LBQ56_04885 [Synergistaceae bacterium]|nr:hypothetical protein [Synergistaceae bacterium]